VKWWRIIILIIKALCIHSHRLISKLSIHHPSSQAHSHGPHTHHKVIPISYIYHICIAHHRMFNSSHPYYVCSFQEMLNILWFRLSEDISYLGICQWHCILQMPNPINSLFILSFLWKPSTHGHSSPQVFITIVHSWSFLTSHSQNNICK